MSATVARPLAGRRCVVAGDDTPLRAALAAGLEGAGAAVARVAAAATRADADRSAATAATELGGPPDVLVAVPPALAAASIDELGPDAFGAALDGAYRSPLLHTQALLPALREGGDGRIAYVTSAAGVLGRAYAAHLAAGARAAIALMRTVACEEAPAVTANAIATGPMAGDALLAARARGIAEQTGVAAGEAEAEVARRIPLGRLIEPEDVLQTLVWALRRESAFLTGEVLTVAGASELQVWP
jgi:NAD(P)-dependent dehydrogenase (short-subunit alcohol dehydrogenase family)